MIFSPILSIFLYYCAQPRIARQYPRRIRETKRVIIEYKYFTAVRNRMALFCSCQSLKFHSFSFPINSASFTHAKDKRIYLLKRECKRAMVQKLLSEGRHIIIAF